MTIFFLNQRGKKLLFESKVKVTLFSSKKVDKRSLIKRKTNEEVKDVFWLCTKSRLPQKCNDNVVLFGNFQEGVRITILQKEQKMCQKKPMSAYPAGRAAPTVPMTAPALSRRINICDLLSSPSKPCVCCWTSLACWWSTTFAKQR